MFSFLGLGKLESGLAVLAVLLLAFLGWSYHERRIGEEAIRAADAKALAIAVQKAAAETIALQKQVDTANQEAKSEQAKLDAYTVANPIGVVRVCHLNPSGAVPQVPGPAGGAQGSVSGSGSVPPVLTSTPGPDISDGLAVLVQAAARLAVLEQERAALIK